ncbi:hypothetical protein FCM35_KLT12762 [Carex littledalei]|uniref:Uncharacterized protein n=1 Tax=Carex littledalei TaxID=544730 RepID=A0A833QFK7_9POAL|nr:hypothetical protein FCM35_KLT12762 [Carex littledalei]
MYFDISKLPFKWESEPGKPKRPDNVEWVPPPSPSPAIQSAQLTREQKKQKIREELRLSRHRSGSPLMPVEGSGDQKIKEEMDQWLPKDMDCIPIQVLKEVPLVIIDED